MPKPITVTRRPMMILTGTNAPRLSQVVKQGTGRSASTTWEFDAAQRIVGPPHLGVVGRMESPTLPAAPVGCPACLARNPASGPSRTASVEWSRAVSGPGAGVCPACRFAGSRGRSSEAEHQLPKLRTGFDSRRPLSASAQLETQIERRTRAATLDSWCVSVRFRNGEGNSKVAGNGPAARASVRQTAPDHRFSSPTSALARQGPHGSGVVPNGCPST